MTTQTENKSWGNLVHTKHWQHGSEGKVITAGQLQTSVFRVPEGVRLVNMWWPALSPSATISLYAAYSASATATLVRKTNDTAALTLASQASAGNIWLSDIAGKPWLQIRLSVSQSAARTFVLTYQ